MSVAQQRAETTPLSSYSINTTLQGFQKSVYNFVVCQGAQKLPAKVQMKSLIY